MNGKVVKKCGSFRGAVRAAHGATGVDRKCPAYLYESERATSALVAIVRGDSVDICGWVSIPAGLFAGPGADCRERTRPAGADLRRLAVDRAAANGSLVAALVRSQPVDRGDAAQVRALLKRLVAELAELRAELKAIEN